jgi:hypothetical protein
MPAGEVLPPHDDTAAAMPVQPVGRGRRNQTQLLAIVAVVAFAIGLSVAKPWGSSGGGASGVRGHAGDSAAPGALRSIPTPSPTPPDVSAAFCMAPSGWRVTSLEHFAGQTIRVWQTIDPIVASGPLDPRLPVALVVSTSVTGLGWCAPPNGDERTTGPVTTTIWRVGEDGVASRVTPGVGARSGVLGADYPPPDRGGTTVDWPPGRYVFDVEGGGPRDSHWFAVEVVRFVVDGRTSPAPRVVHQVEPARPSSAPLP